MALFLWRVSQIERRDQHSEIFSQSELGIISLRKKNCNFHEFMNSFNVSSNAGRGSRGGQHLKEKPAGSRAWISPGYIDDGVWEKKKIFDGVKLSINVPFLPFVTFKSGI